MESQVIASFKTRTHRLAIGGQTQSQVGASWRQVAKKQPCVGANPSENDTEANLRQVALGGQTMKNLRQLACEFELNQSDRKPLQVITSAFKQWSNGIPTCVNLRWVAKTCNSVWPGI